MEKNTGNKFLQFPEFRPLPSPIYDAFSMPLCQEYATKFPLFSITSNCLLCFSILSFHCKTLCTIPYRIHTNLVQKSDIVAPVYVASVPFNIVGALAARASGHSTLKVARR